MFANRIAIVTGAGSGIGRAVAARLAAENSRLILADWNLKGVQETHEKLPNPKSHYSIQLDVSKSDQVKAKLDEALRHFGPNEVSTMLVNCAGITRDGWMVEMKDDQWDSVIDVNLKGTFLTTRYVCQKMIEAKQSGSIVNISSVSAKIGNLGQANYVATKAAVEGFTRTVAREVGKFNIRCNTVMPGFIDTPMVETVPEKGR